MGATTDSKTLAAVDAAVIGRTAPEIPLFTVTTPEGPPRTVLPVELWRLRQHTTTAEFRCATTGARRHRFRGPLLHDLLVQVIPAVARAPRRTRAQYVLQLCGRDGHRAVVSWAEIDPEFSGGAFLLATLMDGAALGAMGPQLVSPGDGCGARYISAITAIHAVLSTRPDLPD